MWFSEKILGAPTTRALNERATAHVLIIGSDKYTRADLASVGCYNYLAAATLSRIIKRDLAVKHVRHLFDTLSPTSFVLPFIGPICLAVLGAAFQLAGVGGDTPLEAWVVQHRGKDDPDTFVTFSTLKHQEHLREAHEKANRRRRDTGSRGRRRLHRLRDTGRGVGIHHLR